ncbi:MAG TPA: wax ester/triacylglycerol synthase family O-acyltransferase [Solirubrobacteraceae bacterium]|nr:wax ester/triacylglycerol synthase family O-acyltransferase [Solirubrobacteraceae bacterium]
MEWMSPQDASFLHIEGPNTPMHIGGVSIFEGPAPPFDRLEEMVASKLDAVPRYRQKVRFVPLALGPPAWVDDPHFNLGYHLRHSALPTPGTEEVLRRTAARIFAQHLDRRKPLWEIWMVEGVSENRWALLSKVHHCMVDGVSATDLMTVMFDDSPPPSPEQSWHPAPEPTGAELVVRSLTHQAANPAEQLQVLREAVRRPRASLAHAQVLVRGMSSAAGLLQPPDSSSLTGSIGPHRTWSTAYVHLSDVKAIRSVLGGTVNDVVLTIVTGGLRELLDSRGENVEGRGVRALVPVSVRAGGEQGVYNNQVSAMLPTLPVGTEDPVERLLSVRTQMDRLKQSGQAVAGEVLTSLSGFAPPLLLALGGRLAARSPNLGVQTGVTNVPGPQQPLQTLGRRLLESFPFVPLIGNVRISIAIFSYDGGLYFGVTGDYDSSRDIDVLTAGVERGAAGLLRASQPVGGARDVAPKRPKSQPRRAHSAGAPPAGRA